MILDTYDTVYVWVGQSANMKEEWPKVAMVSLLMLS